MNITPPIVALVAALTFTSVAHADGSSGTTLGVGAGVGYNHAGGPDEDAKTQMVNQANVRLKLLSFLAVDYAIDLGRDESLVTPPDDQLHYTAKMRLTGLIYPYSGDKLAFYFGGGIGGGRFSELFKTDAAANSYHFGGGFEFHLGAHLSVDLSFMLVAPGARSVENVAVARVEAALAEGDPKAMSKLEAPGLDDFLSVKNHELMLRVMLYL